MWQKVSAALRTDSSLIHKYIMETIVISKNASKVNIVKIDKLTPEQEARMNEFRDNWLAIGLSTEKVDHNQARIAVAKMYKCAGLKPPAEIIFVNGPNEAYKLLKNRNFIENVNDFMTSFIYGSNEASWLSFYDYLREVCGVRGCQTLDGLISVSKTCGWVSVFGDLAVVQERPLHIKFDEQNRLHSENGPAILFRDTFSIYAWHGTRIPAEWIRDKSLDAKTALTLDNIEKRRVACEIVGWINILKELNAKVIDKDDDATIGTLLRVNIPDIGDEQFLKVLCGTGREFAIPVPPNVKTALEANAWTYGIEPEKLRDLEIRT